jgi:hypothetical protein
MKLWRKMPQAQVKRFKKHIISEPFETINYYSTICLRVKSEKLKKEVSYRVWAFYFCGRKAGICARVGCPGTVVVKAGFDIELPAGEHKGIGMIWIRPVLRSSSSGLRSRFGGVGATEGGSGHVPIDRVLVSGYGLAYAKTRVCTHVPFESVRATMAALGLGPPKM